MSLAKLQVVNPSITYLQKRQSRDGSTKYLWRLPDSKTVESIYFDFYNFETNTTQSFVCVSTQVGCNVGCAFCATAKQLNERNLTPMEIYSQVALTIADLKLTGQPPLYQIALAGMGEALLNFENVTEASRLILQDHLAETVSVSTSGVVPRIRQLPETVISKLFISLHATTDETRYFLVPMNKKYPIAQLLAAARDYSVQTGRQVTISYLMFKGVNDTEADLARLTRLLDPASFVIQLCEWNPVEDIRLRPSERIDEFEEALKGWGYSVYVARSKGQDIDGGCGQLRSRYLNELNGLYLPVAPTRHPKNLAIAMA
jgi:23S rRNA (adenine2503-C2)-methyltransferase